LVSISCKKRYYWEGSLTYGLVSKVLLVLEGVKFAIIEVIFHELLVPFEHIFESSEFSHRNFIFLNFNFIIENRSKAAYKQV